MPHASRYLRLVAFQHRSCRLVYAVLIPSFTIHLRSALPSLSFPFSRGVSRTRTLQADQVDCAVGVRWWQAASVLSRTSQEIRSLCTNRYVRLEFDFAIGMINSEIDIYYSGPNHIHISDGAAIPFILGSKDFIKGGRKTISFRD